MPRCRTIALLFGLDMASPGRKPETTKNIGPIMNTRMFRGWFSTGLFMAAITLWLYPIGKTP